VNHVEIGRATDIFNKLLIAKQVMAVTATTISRPDMRNRGSFWKRVSFTILVLHVVTQNKKRALVCL